MRTILHLIALIAVGATMLFSCGGKAGNTDAATISNDHIEELTLAIKAAADSADGHIGVAVITSDGDTVTVNNTPDYPLMSVFKIHEAIAVVHRLDRRNQGLDSIVTIERSSLNPDTWSPMLKERTETKISISIGELLNYILGQSDNNASNYMFENIVSVAQTDSLIRRLTGRNDFSLIATEGEMMGNHELSRENRSTPLACAVLIDKVMTDSLVSQTKQNEIREMLLNCATGQDRIYTAIKDTPGAKLAHKTGSGYRDSLGRLMAHNDVGQVVLPDGRRYTLAVLVTDFNGTEEEASEVIARIARIVHEHEN